MTGTKKEGVLEMAGRLIRDYGEKSLLSHKDIAAMAAELKLPLVKTAQVAASLELGRRLYDRNAAGLPVIRNAKDVYHHLEDMRNLSKEHLRGLYLNRASAHHPRRSYLHRHRQFQSLSIREKCFKLRRWSTARPRSSWLIIILPASRSQAPPDVAVTKQLIEAGKLVGISLLDHVIITKHGFASIEADYS